MSIVFFGTTAYSAHLIEAILSAGHKITLVVTLADRPSHRGHKLLPTPVKKIALERELPFIAIEDVADPRLVEKIEEVSPELGVVVAFKILPKSVYDAPELGTINVHPSLLPDLRGPAPLRWAIIRGLKETGITTFQLVDRPDAGNILLQKRVEIGPNETWGELSERIIPISANVLLETIDRLCSGKIAPQKQDHTKATKAPKIKHETAIIDWRKPARDVHNLIRGLAPKPGASTEIDGAVLKIFESRVTVGIGNPGEVIAASPGEKLIVACGEGAIEIKFLQVSGKKAMDAASFLLGRAIRRGTILK